MLPFATVGFQKILQVASLVSFLVYAKLILANWQMIDYSRKEQIFVFLQFVAYFLSHESVFYAYSPQL